ncbi:MAG: endonuclease/exonuclease/phosphatase family protein [Myxococcales bacterium]|jgi:vancomycin resistance protein VanJ
MRQGLDVALRAACVVHLVVLAGATAVAAFVGDRYWPVALFLLLPLPALVAPAALIAPALILARRWRWLLAQAVAVVLASVFLLGGAVSIPDRPTGPTFRVLAWNVKFGGAGVHAFARELRSVGPDVAIFEATSHEVHEALALAFPSFHIERLSSFSIASRFPISDRSVPWDLATRSGPPYARFTLQTPWGPVKLFAVHPVSQRGAFRETFRNGGLRRAVRMAHFLFTEDYERREKELSALAAEAAAAPRVLVAGDFNVAGRSQLLASLFPGFQDSFTERGTGFGYTFPVGHPFLRLDRILGKGVRFARTGVGGKQASDHRPVYADVALLP